LSLATATSYMGDQTICMEGVSTGKHIKWGHVSNSSITSSYLV
jgi:hypothetical protein